MVHHFITLGPFATTMLRSSGCLSAQSLTDCVLTTPLIWSLHSSEITSFRKYSKSPSGCLWQSSENFNCFCLSAPFNAWRDLKCVVKRKEILVQNALYRRTRKLLFSRCSMNTKSRAVLKELFELLHRFVIRSWSSITTVVKKFPVSKFGCFHRIVPERCGRDICYNRKVKGCVTLTDRVRW